ncbi:sugar transferase [Oceanirhabdus sp. W0125-5]|nr:sugar transferase [Oceanirhabdus sp. W0125-5]WBW98656.1 sugar transferase [Oceanirhabdus sp. W0125-5]
MEPNLQLEEFVNEYSTEVVWPNLWYFSIKRVIDIIGALAGLIVLSPVFLIIGISIKVGSKGKVIFGHTRLGMNGKPIKVYKFRSMYENAKEMMENFTPEQKEEFEKNFKLENDPRITKIGKFLRESSLDELPQLINILKGDMTIVGPRPIVEREIEKYGVYGDKFLSAKPGLTGLWQVSGRSDTTYEERVLLDMEYIDKRTVLGDIVIILKTVGVVFNRIGAR